MWMLTRGDCLYGFVTGWRCSEADIKRYFLTRHSMLDIRVELIREFTLEQIPQYMQALFSPGLILAYRVYPSWAARYDKGDTILVWAQQDVVCTFADKGRINSLN